MRRLPTVVSLLIAVISVLVFYRGPFSELANAAAHRILRSFPPWSAASSNRSGTTSGESQAPAPETPEMSEAAAAAAGANMSVPRAIRKVFLAVEQSEGVGAKVRRSIGTSSLRNLSPFLMLDHFSVKPGAGFPDQ